MQRTAETHLGAELGEAASSGGGVARTREAMRTAVGTRWWPLRGNSLQTRILEFMALGTALSLGILGALGYYSVRQTIDRSLDERHVLALSTANHVEAVLEQNLRLLSRFGESYVGQQGAGRALERPPLRELYFETIFDEEIFILDAGGKVVTSEPRDSLLGWDGFSSLADLGQAIQEHRVAVSSAYYRDPDHRPLATAIVPLSDRDGVLSGWIGGSIDLTGPTLVSTISTVRPGSTGYAEIVDATGLVLASTRPENLMRESDHGDVLKDLNISKRSTVRTCHTCHVANASGSREDETLAFAPLQTVPWGVSIRQSQAEMMAPVRTLRNSFILFGSTLMLVNLALAFGISRGVVRPVRALTESAQKLTSGDLEQPIPPLGKDEVGVLGRSLETMRQQLQRSMEAERQWSSVLESRVTERTSRLEESRAEREQLLRRIIFAQEEERKRVARELHDEVSQNIATLGLALDRATEDPTADTGNMSERLAEMRGLVLRTTEEVRRIMLDLRPSVLDDLGLVAALRWYAKNRLESEGTKVHWDLPDEEGRLPLPLEVALFRVAQEAITNIARHAQAQHVIIVLEIADNAVEMRFEDDGTGFDTQEVLGRPRERSAFGIMGMQERAAVLNGTLTLDTQPGEGTVLTLRIPPGSGQNSSYA